MGAGEAIPTVRNQGNRLERLGQPSFRLTLVIFMDQTAPFRLLQVPKMLCWQLMR